MRTITFAFLVNFASTVAFAQSGDIFPVPFDQYFNSYQLLNPAAAGTRSNVELFAEDRELTGALQGVRTYFVNANAILNPNTKGVRHIAGMYFINDKEGNYFNRSRASLLYGIHLRVAEDIFFNAGASFGFVNFVYKGSNISAGGSSFAPNADVGLWLYNKNFNAGVSFNQIFQGKIQPMDEAMHLKRFVNIYGDRNFSISPSLDFRPAFTARLAEGYPHQIRGTGIATIHSLLVTGAGYSLNEGFTFVGGVKNIELNKTLLQLLVSYYSPYKVQSINNFQRLEFSLNFFFVEKEQIVPAE
ncbi:MAG: type IX secretion system membrane protein PorP/SprF [Cytophagaceae bacterium]